MPISGSDRLGINERNNLRAQLRAIEAKSTTTPDQSGQINDRDALNSTARAIRSALNLKPTDAIGADE